MLEAGSDVLRSLLGGNTLQGISGALSKFTGIGPGAITQLLGYLGPLVFGTIASQWKGKTPTAQGLQNMFAEQAPNIAKALPSGLSLKGIPGLPAAAAVAAPIGAARREESSPLSKWLPLLLGLGLLALLAWYASNRWSARHAAPAVSVAAPTVTQLANNLSTDYGSLTNTLAGVHDAASAGAALPALTAISERLDSLKSQTDKLPEASRAAINDVGAANLDKVKALVASVLQIPGVSEKLKPTLDAIIAKLTAIGA